MCLLARMARIGDLLEAKARASALLLVYSWKDHQYFSCQSYKIDVVRLLLDWERGHSTIRL